MSEVTLGDLVKIAVRMSQEMYELCGDARESGCKLASTEDLLDTWNAAYLKYNNQNWIYSIANRENVNGKALNDSIDCLEIEK